MTTTEDSILSENQLKFNSLKKSIHAILSGQMMTTRELVDCLMSEPYSLTLDDLDLITATLNYLMSIHAIQAGFKADEKNISIEASFTGTPGFCFMS